MFRGSKLHLTIEQKNSLKSLMKNTTDKRQYRRLLAILQKSNGRTLRHIKRTCRKYQISPEMGLCISREWNHGIGDKEDWQLAISYNR
jgi:hypothetical protein